MAKLIKKGPVLALALLQVVLPAPLVDLARGPGHLARPLPAAIEPRPLKHLPAAQVVGVELDTALAVGLVVNNVPHIHSELELQPILINVRL